MTLKVVTFVGTRPELIRLSAVIERLDRTVEHLLVHTGQNYDFELNELLRRDLGIRTPDIELTLDTASLGASIGGILVDAERVLREQQPDAVLILGDTNSCLAGLMAKRLHIPLFHMEAGNRCFDENVPEETNRRIIDHIADINLVYTEHARRNLLREGLEPRRIHLTGSPMFEVLQRHRAAINASPVLAELHLLTGEYLVVSCHREENVDDPARLGTVVTTINALAAEHQAPVVVSMHPRTRQRIDAAGLTFGPRVVAHRPFGFHDYNHLQLHARCVVSDSGTVSEESAMLGFPAVTIRSSIERPEAMDTGGIIVCGIETEAVLLAVRTVVQQRRLGEVPPSPAEYQVTNTSQRVVNLIIGLAGLSNEWSGVRRAAQPG